MVYAMELITFSIFEDAEPDFLEANAAINRWLRRQPGFVARQLVRKDDGGWVDIVTWRDENAANSASATMPSELGESDAMRAIDLCTVRVTNAAIGLSFSV